MKQAMGLKKQERTALKAWSGLLLGVAGLFLLIMDKWHIPSIIMLALLLVIALIFIICLGFSDRLKRKGLPKKISKFAAKAQIEHAPLPLLIGAGTFGIGLVQRGSEIPQILLEHIPWLIELETLGMSLTLGGEILKTLGVIIGFSGIIYFYVWACRQIGKKKLKEAHRSGN